jgi:hypothetical protein
MMSDDGSQVTSFTLNNESDACLLGSQLNSCRVVITVARMAGETANQANEQYDG